MFFCPFRLSLAPTICPWVSEDAFEEYRSKSQASGTQKETRERSSRVMGSLPAGYKITVCPSLHTSKTLDKIDGKNVAFSLIWEKRGLFFHFIPSKIEGGVGIGDLCYVVFPTNHNILTFWPAFISPLHYNLLVRNLAKVITRRKVGKTREKGEAQEDIPLNHSMDFSNRGHPTKPYHNTVKIRFNYRHLSITDSLLCPLGKKALTFSLNSDPLV